MSPYTVAARGEVDLGKACLNLLGMTFIDIVVKSFDLAVNK